jgi:hypothetical protein
LILVVGARGASYPDVYAKVRQILCGNLYRQKKSLSRMVEISVPGSDMSYDLKGRFGDRQREVYRLLLDRIQQCGAQRHVEPNALKQMVHSTRDTTNRHATRKWTIRIFRKHSWRRANRRSAAHG